MADNSTPMESSLDSDDSINLESKVLLALLRLRYNKTPNKKCLAPKAVSCKKVVEFLKANYSWLDGDIQSQVRTVLLSFVKIGIVCFLENSKYLLLVPNSKSMNSSCITRPSHGPQCCCFFTLKCNLRTTSNFCCVLKSKCNKKGKAGGKKHKKKGKCMALSCGQNLRSGQMKSRKLKLNQCLGSSQNISSKKDSESYSCSQNVTSKPCLKCNSDASKYSVPFDTFSPRDEVSDPKNKI